MAFDINSIPGFDAQVAHLATGAASTFAVALWLSQPVAGFLMLGIWFAKEAAEALGIAPWEPKQSWSSSMVDFAWFSAGIGLALGVLALHQL